MQASRKILLAKTRNSNGKIRYLTLQEADSEKYLTNYKHYSVSSRIAYMEGEKVIQT